MGFQLGIIDFLVKEFLPRVKSRKRVLSLARQTIATPPQIVRDYLEGARVQAQVAGYGWDSPATSRELFLGLGFEEYEDIDVSADEGCTIVHDLNLPVDAGLHDRYDAIIEIGTLEHIFDVRSVFENIIRMLKVGGTVCHVSPLDWVNHGFYNFSMNLFHDVYRCNGFTDLRLFLIAFPVDWGENARASYGAVDFTPSQIALKPPPGTLTLVSCIAVKEREVDPFQVPAQAAYDPTLRIDSPLKTWR